MSTAAATVSPSAATGGFFNSLSGVVAFLARVSAARRCAAAITVDRQPSKRDLAVLGLESMDFGNLPR